MLAQFLILTHTYYRIAENFGGWQKQANLHLAKKLNFGEFKDIIYKPLVDKTLANS